MDLPQKARDRANERHVAPHQPRAQYERIVAIVLRAAAHHHQEGRLETMLVRLEIDRAAVGALEHHVVKPDVGLG